MAKIRITQTKSTIKRPIRQRLTLLALGLKKINRSVEHEVSPSIMGMVRAVEHLIHVEQI
ncbi:MAG: 50S ribosomal protein L30 [Cytophagales bacterium]|nr:MAG: 50S ribosomal protein L30 [Cytophagales bacterium]TAF62455.1 MAG: 50S ribosomal protein L30 [Cytophagales bacterium]